MGLFRNDDRGIRLLIALGCAATFVGTILAWTRGALLYGGDNIGVFVSGDFWLQPRVDYIVPSLVAYLAPRQPGFDLYLSLGIEAFLCAYAAQFFARQFAGRTFSRTRLLWLGGLTAGLYQFSPVAISYWYVGLVTNVYVSSAAFFVVLALALKLGKSFGGSGTFDRWDAVVLGVALGLSAPPSIPNDIRVVGVCIVILVGLVLLGVIRMGQSPSWKRAVVAGFRRLALGSVPLALLLLFYPFYNFATSPGFNFGSVQDVASAYSLKYAGTAYDTIDLAVRMLGRTLFPHNVYYVAYTGSPALTLASFAWPFFALVVPTALAVLYRFPDRVIVLGAEFVAIPIVFWEAGSNPPLGAVHDGLASMIPYANSILQTYSLTLILLSKIYPLLIAFSLVALWGLGEQWLARGPSYDDEGPTETPSPPSPPSERPFDPPARWRSPAIRGVAFTGLVVLVVLVAAEAWPIYTGDVERTTWDPNQHGYFLPSTYWTARSTILSTPKPGVLVLPSIGTYFRTSWGYYGANGFYSNLLYPASVVVPRLYGQYSLYLNTTTENYSIATSPLQPDLTTVHPLNVSWNGEKKLVLPTGYLRYSFIPKAPLNLSGAKWLRLQIPYIDPAVVNDAIGTGNLWLGMTSSQTNATILWWHLGQASNAFVESLANRTLTADLLLDASSSGGTIGFAHVNSLLALFQVQVPTFGILSPPTSLAVVAASAISPQWRSSMTGLGISYLLVDYSISAGLLEPIALVNDTVAVLAQLGFAFPVLTLPTVEVYAIATQGA